MRKEGAMEVPTTSNWKDWHIPLSKSDVVLGEAYESLSALGARQEDVPLMVQLVENPKYDFPGFDIFHGAVNLRTHDLIHILLGRGLLTSDEAFTIGFTMGSTNKVSTTEEELFAFASQYLYPKVYKFGKDALHIFRDAAKLGFISDCEPLDEIDFDALMDKTLAEAREAIGLEADLLGAYYGIEQRRYTKSKASARLLG
jgi:hypothetical protein